MTDAAEAGLPVPGIAHARRAPGFPAKRRARLRQMLFEWLHLEWTLPSGVNLVVATYGDWIVDRLRQRGEGEVAITAVEAHPPWVRELQSRMLESNRVAGQVRIVAGLVGRRSGTARFHESTIFGAGAGVEMPYVDRSLALADVPRIDLLECDIEGAEQLFIETYPDLLRKTRVAVFELHADLCDVAHGKRGLAEAGFTESAVLRAGDPYSTYAVWR